MNAVTTIQPGTAFGPYTLVRELGRGGMGTVYLAEVAARPGAATDSDGAIPAAAAALAPGTRVAIKTFHAHLVSSGDFARRFRREARVGASIRHENVVRTLDAGMADLAGAETHYLAMELVEGQTLRELVREMGRVPEELARAIARQAAAGLDAIHRAGITHRDLKPENVILTRDHRVKLMDLGVAKVREESIRLSLTGQFLGSVHYAAPEQFRAPESVDARADLYALGVLLHEMIEGRNPFFHEDLSVVLKKTLTELPRRLSIVVPETSAVLDQLAASLLAKDPADRLASAAETADVLERGEESAWWVSSGRRLWSQVAARATCRMAVAREVPYVGHEEELGVLRREFDLAAAGARRVVLLEGEAGVGKTRLADEFAASLAEAGVPFRFTFGVAPARGTGRPYHVFCDALQRALGAEDPAAALAALLPAGTQAAELAALVTGAPSAPGAEMPVERARTLFAAAFRALAAGKPLLVVLDDLQNAGADSATLLAYLAHDDPATPLCLVASYRPPDESLPLHGFVRGAVHGGREENVVTVRLGRLGAKEVGQFLRNVLKSERAVQELGFRLLERTEGNPHFLIEVLRSLQDEHVLKRRDDGGWTMASTRVELHVPDSVRELVQTQLAAVGEDEREILDVAAVAGAEFDPEVVAEVLGQPKIAVLKRLSMLERRHHLIRAAGRRCRFEHPQLRETIYDALMEGLREAYHAQIAESLTRRRAGAGEDGAGHLELFRHLVLGGQADGAAPHALPALEFAAKNLRADEGADLARRYLALVAPSADAAPSSGSAAISADAAAAALRAEVRLRLAGFLEHEGSRGEERAVLESALADARAAAGEDGAAAALAGRVLDRRLLLFLAFGEFAAAEETCREAFRLASRRKDRDAALAGLVNLAAALRCRGRYDAAAAALRRALKYVIHAQSRLRRSILLSSLALVESQRGRRRTAQRHYLEATALAKDFGIGPAGDAADTQHPDDDDLRERFLGLSRALGRSADARVDGERTILVGGAVPRRVREGGALSALAGVATHLGLHDDARGLLQGALRAVRDGGDLRAEAAVLHALGENASERRAPEAARRWFTEALELRRRIGHRPGACETLLALGQLAALGGSVQAARPYLEEATELAPALEMPAIAALARATSALLHAREGRPERARAELEEARKALGDPGPLSVASRVEGLWFASLAARALGDESAAQQHVVRAWDILSEVALAMDADQRRTFLLETSPHREIVEAVGAKV